MKEQLRNLIGKGKTLEAINQLKTYCYQNNIDNDLDLLTARVNKNNRDQNLGLLSFSEYSVENNKLNQTFFYYMDEYIKETTNNSNYQSNQSTQNNSNDMDIVQLKVFLRDFGLYPKSSETAIKVKNLSQSCYNAAYQVMSDDLSLVRDVFQPWDLSIKTLNRPNIDWNDVLENLEYIKSYVEMMSNDQELNSQGSDEIILRNAVQDGTFDDLVKYINWKIKHTADKVKTQQWQLDLDLDRVEFQKVSGNVFTKATKLRSLRSTWLNKL